MSAIDTAAGDGEILISFEAVTRRFGSTRAVDGLSLDIRAGEFFALLGPSGCGKTTLLRMLAGFEMPDEGRLRLAGADITAVPPHRRPVNMMFQNYALFPHLSVAGNIAFGLRQEGLASAEIARRVDEMLALVKLEGLGQRKPDQLSGGQRQRVALARALVKRPRVLLLDEPLAALDKKLREQTQFELTALQRQLGTTFVIVTHDQDEAMMLADRIAVMDRGRLVQVGTPAEVYERPRTRWVAEFVGDVGLIEGCVLSAAAIGTAHGEIAADAAGLAPGATVTLALRPEAITLSRDEPIAAGNRLAGVVVDAGYRGDRTIYQVQVVGGARLKASVPNAGRQAGGFAVDDRVWLSWQPGAATVLKD